MPQAVRVHDTVLCVAHCKGHHPCPRGRVITASPDTFIENKRAARAGDITSNCCGACCPCPNKIINGSPKTFINNRPAATVKSKVTLGFFVTGSSSTFID